MASWKQRLNFSFHLFLRSKFIPGLFLTLMTTVGAATALASGAASSQFDLSTHQSAAPHLVTSANVSSNGSAVTWDGRLLISTSSNGWSAYALRTQYVTRTIDGKIVFNLPPDKTKPNDLGAFSGRFSLLAPVSGGKTTVTTTGKTSRIHNLNALALVPAIGTGVGDNPYRSNEAGVPDPNGTLMTYDAYIYSQLYPTNDTAARNEYFADKPNYPLLGRMRVRIIVKGLGTGWARVSGFSIVDGEDFDLLRDTSGQLIRGMEPTLTVDGRFLVFNLNAPDKLMYLLSVNPPALNTWSAPKDLSALFSTDSQTVIDGVKVRDRYALANAPLRSNTGEIFSSTDQIKGAYAWLSWEGSELFFMGLQREGDARRAGFSVIGRWTGHRQRVIDGAFSNSISGADRTTLFTTSFGSTSSIWNPFRELRNSALPSIYERPSYFLYHGTAAQFAEVGFKDFVDGRYVVSLPMKEAIRKVVVGIPNSSSAEVDLEKTADISGNDATGFLSGGAFFDNVLSSPGFKGQAITFNRDSLVRVESNPRLEQLKSVSAELLIRPLEDLSSLSGNQYIVLLKKEGVFDLVLEKNRSVQGSVFVGGKRVRTGAVGPALALKKWTHVAMTYDQVSGAFNLFFDGTPAYSKNLRIGVALDSSVRPLIIGPSGLNPELPANRNLLMLDEVKISEIARSSPDFLDSRAVPAAGRPALPFGVSKSLATAPHRYPAEMAYSSEKAQLGAELFGDPRLSGNSQVSCKTCHNPNISFQDGMALSKGVFGKLGTRHTPILINRIFGINQNWDARFNSVVSQVSEPIRTPHEMNLSHGELRDRLGFYKARFEAVFPNSGGLNLPNVQIALATFVSSITSEDSIADQVEMNPSLAKKLFTADEMAGRDLFFNKARCIACHSGPNWTDELKHSVGFLPSGADAGFGGVSNRESDRFYFKTPSLRNVADTAPYFHDGSLSSLETIVELYNAGGKSSDTSDPEIKPLGLTTTEKLQLVAYLKKMSSKLTDRTSIKVSDFGHCGSAAGNRFHSAPNSQLCDQGSASSVSSANEKFEWTCSTPNSLQSTICRADKVSPIAGACGAANKTRTWSAPASGLCSSGLAGPVSGNGDYAWAWKCEGQLGGATSSCATPSALICPSKYSPLASSEGREEKVRYGYCLVLNRRADIGGFKNYVGQTRPMSAIMLEFFVSKEFKDRFFGGTDYRQVPVGNFVDQVYYRILNRAPDAGGRDAWIRNIEIGKITRENVILSFMKSTEFKNRFGSLAD